MKIVLTGGATGGHFYPLIAVAEAIEDICAERTLIEPELIYTGPMPFDKTALLEHDIEYKSSPAGPMRRYGGIINALSFVPMIMGIIRATTQLFSIYPDVVFSTGGYAAFPTLYAARLLKIPVIIYDADAAPGRVSLWSSKFAKWIAIAHPDAARQYPQKLLSKIARTGHPIRKEIVAPTREGGYEFLKLDPDLPVVFIMGGSQGARAINETVLDVLAELVESYNVIHQTGAANLDEVKKISSVILKGSRYAERYRVFGLLNTLALRMSAGIATVVVARAGSGSIFEIASWGVPAILVPIPEDVSHDQTENAFSYARSGAAIVIEQKNLSPHVLISEINRLIADSEKRSKMSEAAHAYARPDAARKIATVLLESVIEHEPV
ncbi:MAG TPA: UDP-N-acetylglucosamine--N-acetylmuramyl-(pentapeptide) pyrophosphoryl-undecaprenol N-acetylglucosamine transferase [Candidatus Paceibacterota bacterium]|nr:UDP-N-acetylglucosamine--N-acetylmuramyl-(pentapeptide) pyrophosphoryl-undecaprenol N-acetylglucosamine transferase [Candidatus Paceibacterota bacterium]